MSAKFRNVAYWHETEFSRVEIFVCFTPSFGHAAACFRSGTGLFQEPLKFSDEI